MSIILCVSKGLADAPWIRQQFTSIEQVIEIPERLTCQGTVHYPFDAETALVQLQEAQQQGATHLQSALMYADAYSQHEEMLYELAHYLSFDEVLRTPSFAVLEGEIQSTEFLRNLTRPAPWLEHHYPVIMERCRNTTQGLELHFRWLATAEVDLSVVESQLGMFILRADEKLQLPPYEKSVRFYDNDLFGVLIN